MFHLDTSLSRTPLESLSSIRTRGTSFSLLSQSKDIIQHQHKAIRRGTKTTLKVVTEVQELELQLRTVYSR